MAFQVRWQQVAKPGQQRQHLCDMHHALSSRPSRHPIRVSAQANTSAFTRAFIKPVSQPSPSSGLLGRRLSVNPLETAQHFAEDAMQRIDIFMAARINRALPVLYAVIAAQTLLTLTGTDILSSLQLVKATLSDLAPWNFSLSGLIMNLAQAAIAALPAAWVLRSWIAATCTLATTAAAGTARAAGAAADATSLAQRAAAAGLSGAGAAAVAAVRLALLLVAHGMVTAGAAGWAPAAAALAASWALLAAAHGKSAAQELQQHTQLAALLAAAEASWLVLSSAAALPVLLAAAGVYAACWALLQTRELGRRMQQRQLHPGSAAQVHLTLKTESGAVLDSTWDGLARPLEATAAADAAVGAAGAASRPPAEVAIDALVLEEQRRGEQQEQQQQQQQQAQHRLSVFLPVVASRLSGRYPGESFELQLTGPGLAVYHNPELVWWQPKEEVVKKLGQVPEAGHVFWYPIRDGAWVPVTVARVSEQYVELDAAAALAEGPMVLQVQVQRR